MARTPIRTVQRTSALPPTTVEQATSEWGIIRTFRHDSRGILAPSIKPWGVLPVERFSDTDIHEVAIA